MEDEEMDGYCCVCRKVSIFKKTEFKKWICMNPECCGYTTSKIEKQPEIKSSGFFK